MTTARPCLAALFVPAVLWLAGCVSLPPAPYRPDPATLIRVGTVQVDASQRMVVATGMVNQVEGAIELFACGTRGKTHESVLVLDLYPVDLHAALVLLGLSNGPPAAAMGEGPPRGDALDIWIAWEEAGRPRVERAERWIAYRAGGRPLGNTAWVFTGSTFEDGRYKALVEESLIATYWDPWAIVNIGSDVGADDERLIVDERAVPPLGTPVDVFFVARGKASPP
jgi:hypothetical protein